MHVTTVLPSNYTSVATIDITKNKKAIATAVVLFVVIFLAASWLVVKFTALFRPSALAGQGFGHILTDSTVTFTPQLFIIILLALVLVMLLHELVHGLFFWRFAGKRPEFNFKALSVYVASPSDVYYPRNKYIMVGSGPLVLLTIIGLLLIMVVPAVFISLPLFFIAFNAAGSAGDLIMIALLLSYSSDTLMQDAGSSVIVYGPIQTAIGKDLTGCH